MQAEAHLSALKDKHAGLDAEIEAESSRPHPDEVRIADLKKRKLRIKDEIARLDGH